MKKWRVFETFAGIGAQHKALTNLKRKKLLDFELAGISEWYVPAILAYNSIHYKKKYKVSRTKAIDFLSNPDFSFSLDSKTPMKSGFSSWSDEKIFALYNAMKNSNNLGSILNITGKKIIDKIGEIDVLTYSFPCQDLSMGASFIGGGAGMAKGSGTRSGLLWEIERIIGELKSLKKLPKVLLLENVKNMLSNNFKKDYDTWIDKLNKTGYHTETFILDSSEFGVPQKRQRVFAISVLKTEKDWIKKLQCINFKKKKLPSIKSFLREDYSDNVLMEEAIDSMVNRTPSRKFIYEKSRKLNIENHKYTKTLTTKQDRNPNSGVISLKNTIIGDANRNGQLANFRFLTPREQFLLMGFTDKDFERTKNEGITKRTYWVLAGNSIVVNVVQEIFKEILC